MSDDDLPTMSPLALAIRARLLRTVREFFDSRGYIEVDTPLLSADIVVDAWLEPIVADVRPDARTYHEPLADVRYLQTSPEFAMKRLLAAGCPAIYQLGKVFRHGENGRRHNPEFTMVEWYRVGDRLKDQVVVVEELVCHVLTTAQLLIRATGTDLTPVAENVLNCRPFERLAYDDAFLWHAGRSVLTEPVATLHALAGQHQLTPPPGLEAGDRDGWLNWLLAELIEPKLGQQRPVFLCDYPPTQAALARTEPRADGQLVAKRFELYIAGVEYCNGYDELTDAAVLRERNRQQNAVRQAAGLRPLPIESRLLQAMERGLPPCSGVALGFDRLAMLAMGADRIEQVIPFPWERA
jgi:lysyl-tRNA synthetase class 2